MLLSLTAFVLPAFPTSAQGVIYVDDSATGAGTGTSWADAFTDLRRAFAAAGHGDTVWVAQGVYRPTHDLDRGQSFHPPTVPVYGGFAGHESSLAERAGLFDRTILSGDLLGDDGPGFANTGDNSYHVVDVLGPWALLDGFTITAGRADSLAAGAYGGGMVCVAADVILRRCRFVSNRASGMGGGLFQLFGSARLEDCTFVGNESGGGGGGVALPASSGTLERCWFLGNQAIGSTGGGGLYLTSATILFDCVLSGNRADGTHGGGGIAGGAISLVRCTLYGNTALGSMQGGGGLLAGGSGSCSLPTVVDSILWGNLDDSGSGQDAQVSGLAGLPPPSVVSSCVQGWVGLPCSAEVIADDPLFVDPDGPDGVAGTLDDLLELGPRSPCLDLGRAFRVHPAGMLSAGTLDAARKRRHVDLLAPGDGRVLDLGALERPAGR